jgi:hypothetical protein
LIDINYWRFLLLFDDAASLAVSFFPLSLSLSRCASRGSMASKLRIRNPQCIVRYAERVQTEPQPCEGKSAAIMGTKSFPIVKAGLPSSDILIQG